VIAGRGREALRLSALGSGLAVAAAVPLAVPVTLAMGRAWPVLRTHLTLVMAAVAALLVLGERGPRAMADAALSLGASGALGLAMLPSLRRHRSPSAGCSPPCSPACSAHRC